MPIDVGSGIVIGPGISFTQEVIPNIPFTMYIEPGRGANLTLILPVRGNTDINVDWGDGTNANFVSTDYTSANAPTKTYSTNANYTVTITGSTSRLEFYDSATLLGERRLTGISSWGNLGVTELGDPANNFGIFQGCGNLLIVPNSLPSTLTQNSFFRAFNNCLVFNDSNVVSWNMSNIVSFSTMFQAASEFNQNIASWNTTNVTSMNNMFNQAVKFNQNIANWNTSNVTTMIGMFLDSNEFDQNLAAWDTSKVTTMANMFRGADVFNGNITTWDTSNVSNMFGMFTGALAFNQNIGGWNVSKVSNTANMFRNTTAFNGNVGAWGNKTANITTSASMANMFRDATAFNQNLASWCVTSIASLPNNFDTGATAWTGAPGTRPQWGTCP